MAYGYEIGRGWKDNVQYTFLMIQRAGLWRFCGDILTGGSCMFDMKLIAFRISWHGQRGISSEDGVGQWEK